jgi:hypothetical protein
MDTTTVCKMLRDLHELRSSEESLGWTIKSRVRAAQREAERMVEKEFAAEVAAKAIEVSNAADMAYFVTMGALSGSKIVVTCRATGSEHDAKTTVWREWQHRGNGWSVVRSYAIGVCKRDHNVKYSGECKRGTLALFELKSDGTTSTKPSYRLHQIGDELFVSMGILPDGFDMNIVSAASAKED